MPRKKKLSDKEQFKSMSEEEIVALKERIHNENTEKADKKTEKAFLGFLSVQQNVTDMEYWLYEP